MTEVVFNVVLNVLAIQVINLVYFFKMAPGMDTGLNTSIGNKSRSTTDFGKREIRCCAYCDYGSCFSLFGEWESGAFIFMGFYLFAPDSHSPHACRF